MFLRDRTDVPHRFTFILHWIGVLILIGMWVLIRPSLIALHVFLLVICLGVKSGLPWSFRFNRFRERLLTSSVLLDAFRPIGLWRERGDASTHGVIWAAGINFLSLLWQRAISGPLVLGFAVGVGEGGLALGYVVGHLSLLATHTRLGDTVGCATLVGAGATALRLSIGLGSRSWVHWCDITRVGAHPQVLQVHLRIVLVHRRHKLVSFQGDLFLYVQVLDLLVVLENLLAELPEGELMRVRSTVVIVSKFVLLALDEEVRDDRSLLHEWVLLRLGLILSVAWSDRVIRNVELRCSIAWLLHARVILLTHHLVRRSGVLGHLWHLLLLEVLVHLSTRVPSEAVCIIVLIGSLIPSDLDFIV